MVVLLGSRVGHHTRDLADVGVPVGEELGRGGVEAREELGVDLAADLELRERLLAGPAVLDLFHSASSSQFAICQIPAKTIPQPARTEKTSANALNGRVLGAARYASGG